MSTLLEKLPASGIQLNLQRSPTLITIYSVMTAFVILALLSLSLSMSFPLALVVCIPLMTVIVLYVYRIFRFHLLLNHPKSINKVVLTQQNWCFVQFNNGNTMKMTLLPNTILTNKLVILNLRVLNEVDIWSYFTRNYSIVLTKDSLETDKFWQVKRYLRFAQLATEDQE